jgi:2-methylfumaryl-CoA hydratase
MTGSATSGGNFFEDFRIGQVLEHGPPRTLTDGDAALYCGLFGARFAPQSAATSAQAIGLKQPPLDDLLVFHTVFGKTVPEVSLNAVANLGYAQCVFLKPVFPGATLSARSRVIGLKENANRQTGVVYVETEGFDETGDAVLRYVRWVMVRKRSENSPAPEALVPKLASVVDPSQIRIPAPDLRALPAALGGGGKAFDAFKVGDRIDHVDGMTVEEAEHMLATRLYHNTARVHFNQHAEAKGRFGRRIVYGGHVISIARALSFNGLSQAWFLGAINGGRHVAPCFAGDTVYAWSEVLDAQVSPAHPRAGLLRLRTIATKDAPCPEFPGPDASGAYPAEVILDLDIWAVCPRGA